MANPAEAWSPPRLVYYVAASVDGFIATADGGVDWLGPYQGGEQDYGYQAFYDSVDALIMGSRSYLQVLGFGRWPYPGKPCRVLTARTLPAEPAEVSLSDQPPETVIAELGAAGARRIWLVGGGALAGACAARGLIDELILTTVPLLLGAGVRLLEGSQPSQSLRLISCCSFADGLVQSWFRRDGR